MNKYELTFPKFEDILNLPNDKKYSFTLFNFYNGYCRIVWNDFGINGLCLDIYLNGYLEEYYIYDEITKENYNNLKQKANDIYNRMIEVLLDIKKEWNDTDIENSYVCSYLDE